MHRRSQSAPVCDTVQQAVPDVCAEIFGQHLATLYPITPHCYAPLYSTHVPLVDLASRLTSCRLRSPGCRLPGYATPNAGTSALPSCAVTYRPFTGSILPTHSTEACATSVCISADWIESSPPRA